MTNAMFSFKSLDRDAAQEAYFPLQEFEGEEEAGKWRQTHFLDMVDWFDIYRLSFENGNSFENGIPSSNDLQSFTEFSMLDEMQIDMFSTAIQSSQEAVSFNAGQDSNQEKLLEKEKVHPISFAALELLKNHISGCKRLSGDDLDKSRDKTPRSANGGRGLSTEDVMRVAAACYVQFLVETGDDLSKLTHPFGSMLPSLSDEETKDVELAQLLLASAEKIGNQQYDRAGNLLKQCSHLSSNVGNPVQRIVYYFADALQERMDREMGRISWKGPVRLVQDGTRRGEDLEEMLMSPDPAVLAFHQQIPISQVIQFTEIQAILENMASAKRIHLIDLRIRVGMQWSILMQALAVRFTSPVELLKISAVGTSKEKIKETGRQLESFAKTLKIPFTFKAVIVSDMNDLKEDLFEIKAGEVVGVSASLILRTMIVRPDCLKNLLRVIRRLNPRIMTVTEVEGNHNSRSFINRFIESLFFFSVWFDCLDDCMDRNDPNRISSEGNFFSKGIRSIVATEGDERVIRHVGISLWRSFFTRFGFVETEPSHASVYQARLVAKQFACGNSLNLDMNGKSLTVGWKGTPLLSFSAWKLRRDVGFLPPLDVNIIGC